MGRVLTFESIVGQCSVQGAWRLCSLRVFCSPVDEALPANLGTLKDRYAVKLVSKAGLTSRLTDVGLGALQLFLARLWPSCSLKGSVAHSYTIRVNVSDPECESTALGPVSSWQR
jgi:hypothetical protein